MKFDISGEKIWEKRYSLDKSIYVCDVLETSKGDFLIIGVIPSSDKYVIIKTDPSGEFLWQKEIKTNLGDYLLYGHVLNESADNTFIFGIKKSLIKIDYMGNTLLTRDLDYNLTYLEIDTHGDILLGGDRKFEKLDQQFNSIYQVNLTGTVICIESLTQGGYCLLVGRISYRKASLLVRLEENGEELWNQNIREGAHYLSQTSDGGFIITGFLYGTELFGLRLLKVDEYGNFFTVVLNSNLVSNEPKVYSNYKIEWYSNGIEKVNILLSTDGGVRWEYLVENYPSDSSHFNWYVSNTVSDNCLLRIEDSANPELFYLTPTTFNISNVDMYDYISINEIKMWISNNGEGSHDPLTGGNGFYWPGGENGTKSAIFQDGLLYGGKAGGILSVNGNMYRQGLIPGAILENGNRDKPLKFEIYPLQNQKRTGRIFTGRS